VVIDRTIMIEARGERIMNSRERVLLAINHEEADRLPMFRPNMIQTYEPLDERVQEFLDTFEFDRLAGIGFVRARPEDRRELPDGVFEDSYGCRFKYMGVGMPYCIHNPLAYARTIEDVERFGWPDVANSDLVSVGARERAREIYKKGEYATSVGVGMLFHRYHYLRGFEQWLIDMAANPELHKTIADRIHRINSTLALGVLDEVGDYTDIVSFGDDFGTSTDSYMSPDDFRSLVKPYFKDLIGRIKDQFPHVKFYLHSHGQIMDLVPDLIDCGIDILNPVLPLDNMDPVRLKRDFGSQLAFEGGIDIEHILPFGTLDEVKEHVEEVINILAPGGGFIFKAQAISHIIPYENLVTTYNLALEYGRYDN
jgi:uroporphyrinogen decarboxylase